MARAMPPLVAVAIGQYADPVALGEGILKQPLERAPIGMHLDGPLDTRVMRHGDVGIAAADMSEDDAILVLQCFEEIPGRVGVAGEVREIGDEAVMRAMDLPPLM